MVGNTIYAVVSTKAQVRLQPRGGNLGGPLGRGLPLLPITCFSSHVFTVSPWQGPRHFQEPQSCTIYSTIQPTKKVSFPCCDSSPFAMAEKPKSSPQAESIGARWDPALPDAPEMPSGTFAGAAATHCP